MSSGRVGRAVRILWNAIGQRCGRSGPVPVFWESCPPGYAALFRSRPFRTVIDVGAHVGEFATLAHHALPEATILAFEPVRDTFAVLERTILSFGRCSIAFPFALSDATGDCTMFEEAFTPCSSLLPLAPRARKFFPYLFWKTRRTVSQRMLDDVLDGRMLERPVLLKIDVQGMEDRVLRGASRVLENVDVILIESSFVTIYEGQILFPELRALLASCGFRYQGPALQWKAFLGRRTIQEDSVFVR